MQRVFASWVGRALVLLVVAVAAALVGDATADRGDETAAPPATTTLPTQTTATTTAPPPTTTAPPPTTTAPTTTETTPEPPPPSDGLTRWPAGASGYTVVLVSVAESAGRGAASAAARRAKANGLDGVGVLRSANFSSLNPGYYVVFAGRYDSGGEAAAAVSAARNAGFSAAYVRQVTP